MNELWWYFYKVVKLVERRAKSNPKNRERECIKTQLNQPNLVCTLQLLSD